MTKRRGRYDAMAPIPEPTWLVVRNEIQKPLKIEKLEPGADPRMVMVKAMAHSIGLGFEVEELPGTIPIYFCRKGDERRRVMIERVDPLEPPPAHSTGNYAAPERPSKVTPLRKR